ncbi:MAG: translational GTPase TypA [Desulfobacterales bacterium]|nr:translational GTPase TypA [Desulfobacterales bacterium]MBF0396678.1 translational GTPase TypA [Desulfobacterales bacterium]
MKRIAVNDKIRNIAIIAHVDHGKTTLVDAMFKQSGVFRDGQEIARRVMDNLDLERERGITIAAKNCSVFWKNVKINIIDTPGHADFGGEVERALAMADGALLLVDASEGPLPQTRFVLKKTLEAKLKVIVVINKIDRKDARITQVLDEIYDLFIDLDATEEQIDFPVLYSIGRDGVCKKNLEDENKNLEILFDTVLEYIPGPKYEIDEPFQMLVADLGYSDYMGRLAIGRIINGKTMSNDNLICINGKGESIPLKVIRLQVYEGPKFVPADFVEPGDIVVLSGIENVTIGDTICTKSSPKALNRIRVDEPTVSMKFSGNNSPLVGREGAYVQSSRIFERLQKEALKNVAIQVEMTDDKESFTVKGRGEFQMAILVETMRREGFEMCVGRPEVIYKYEDKTKLEPIEHLFIDCNEEFMGIVTEKLSIRKGKMLNLANDGKGRVRIEFSIPSRGLIGYREELLTDTKGTGIINSYFIGYEPYRGDFLTRFTGSLVSDRSGNAVAYALFNLEPRGQLFIVPGNLVYEGMVIGEHSKHNDINVNPCKEKKLSNMRAAGKDENIILTTIKQMTLERAINFIKDDELIEVTPKSIRLRKSVLSSHQRHLKEASKRKQEV